MENENKKLLNPVECQMNITAVEAESFEAFINALVQAVEKYGKTVLRDLECVA